MLFVISFLNNIVDSNLACGTQSPIAFSTGNLNDISPLLQFRFWEPVYYLTDETERSFPGTEEKRGRYVGISENIGHSMTFLIITDDTNKKIERSVVRSAVPKETANLREDPIDFDDIQPILKTKSKTNNQPHRHRYPTRGPSHNYDQDEQRGPSHNHDHDDNIPPPAIDLKQDRKHGYYLRSLNADFDQQSFHFDKPSVAISDINPHHKRIYSSTMTHPSIYNWIHMFSLRIMGRVQIYLMILMGSVNLKSI